MVPARLAGTLHIIEPTLRTHDGHQASLVAAFVRARPGPAVVYADRGAAGLRIENAQVVPYFPRRLRRLVTPWLLARLVRREGVILIATANTADFLALDWALRFSPRPRGRIVLFVHWYRGKPRKDRFLRAFAARRAVTIVTPTAACARKMRDLGFADVVEVPYPHEREGGPGAASVAPARVLVPGGARRDKGFPAVVDYVEHLARTGAVTPVWVQVSGNHWGEFRDGTDAEIARLKRANYPHLCLIERAPGPAEYAALFDGAVVLQPYEPATFGERVSGVTLDAFDAGAPIVATAGTWTAELVERYGCGRVVATPSAEHIAEAVREVMDGIEGFRARAIEARAAMEAERRRSPLAGVLA